MPERVRPQCTSLCRRVLWTWLGARFRCHGRFDRPVLPHRRGHRHARFPALLPHPPARRAPLQLHAPPLHLHHPAPGRHHLARHLLFPRRTPPPRPLIPLFWSAAACRRFCDAYFTHKLSSRAKRPDFFFRAVFWRVGPRSRWISLQCLQRPAFRLARLNSPSRRQTVNPRLRPLPPLSLSQTSPSNPAASATVSGPATAPPSQTRTSSPL